MLALTVDWIAALIEKTGKVCYQALALKSFVDERVGLGGFGSTSEYVRDLIRRDQERERVRGLLLDGAASPPGPIADDSYFESLRDRARACD